MTRSKKQKMKIYWEKPIDFLSLKRKTLTSKLNNEQRKAIEVARQQIKNGQFLTDEKSNLEIDEWQTRNNG